MKPVTFLLLAICALLALATSQQAKAVDGAAIVYGLETVSDDGFQRILKTSCIKYVCVQYIHSKNGSNELARNRADALRKAGKRIVLQIWWGPGGDFPWSKYSFPNIALDGAVRADFFKDVVDSSIASFGAGNLYGVNLLEETGMQFGTDVGPRDNPDDFWTFTDHAKSYDTPFYSGWGNPAVGGVHIANVRRHEKDFTRMTGLIFADSSKWLSLEHYLFDRWASKRLQSLAQVEFAKYVHKRYPRLKAFTWDLLNSEGENPRTDHHLEAQYFDGVITDPYSATSYNSAWIRAYRTLYPKAEIINFSMGGIADTGEHAYASPDTKRSRIVCAYMAGADVLGFFRSPQTYEDAKSWKTDIEILSSLSKLPRFRKKSAVLLISDGLSNVYSFAMAWTGLKYYDFLPTWEAHGVDLAQYQVVILHSNGGESLMYWNSPEMLRRYGLPGYIDSGRLERFVKGGGALILSGPTRMDRTSPFFAARDGYLYTDEPPAVAQTPLAVSPAGWLREKAGINRGYKFTADRIAVHYDSVRVTETEAGYFFKHGKGAVFFFPFLKSYDPKESYVSNGWQDYRQLLSDMTRGVLRHLGKKAIADDYIDRPEAGNYYMQATTDDGTLRGYLLLDKWTEAMTRKNWKLSGRDILTGAANPVLSRERTSALIKSGGGKR